MQVFDEDMAVEFIRKTMPTDKQSKYSDDQILYVIDIMYDWYDKNGFLSMDSDAEEEADIEKMVSYVKKELARDKQSGIDPADVSLIVKGELEYEETLEDFV